jgi:hypothetical protein
MMAAARGKQQNFILILILGALNTITPFRPSGVFAQLHFKYEIGNCETPLP